MRTRCCDYCQFTTNYSIEFRKELEMLTDEML